MNNVITSGPKHSYNTDGSRDFTWSTALAVNTIWV